ncbi:hypothetical protein FQA39_LY08009 [Lamprigera yunnana]|nr:hypothetical protein FQA39_LY08009 [Lamprigera yunnana]
MKLLIACVLCFSSVFAWTSNFNKQETFEEWDRLLAIHRDECIKESGVYKEDVYDIEKTLTFPNYYGFKCYLRCQLNRLQFLDAEGYPDTTTSVSLVAGLDEITVRKCFPEILYATNPCEQAYYYTRCGAFEVMSRFIQN